MSEQKGLFVGLRRDVRGNMAMLFGLSIFVLFAVIGLAIDGLRAVRAGSMSGSAVDAAALAGAKMLHDPNVTDAQIITAVKLFFASEITHLGGENVTFTNLNVVPNRSDNSVSVSVDLGVKTYFGGVIGVSTINFPRTGKVIFAMQKLELAMVLDVTGSMNNNGKIGALKSAASAVIDSLFQNAQFSDSVKIGLAPFSASVNAGPYAFQVTETPTWTSWWGGWGGWTYSGSVDGCVIERLGPGQFTDDAPGPGDMLAWIDPMQAAGSHYVCPPATVVPMTSDPALLKSTISGYGAAGWTAGHIGAAWGWYLLSPNWGNIWPVAPGPYGDPNTNKAVIFLTDGIFNTSYESGLTTAAGQQITESYAQFQTLCANMKAKGITIYTIALDLTDANALNNLQTCASGASNAYQAPTGAQLTGVFMQIAQKLNTLRIAQ